jgi:hypothetical protein
MWSSYYPYYKGVNKVSERTSTEWLNNRNLICNVPFASQMWSAFGVTLCRRFRTSDLGEYEQDTCRWVSTGKIGKIYTCSHKGIVRIVRKSWQNRHIQCSGSCIVHCTSFSVSTREVPQYRSSPLSYIKAQGWCADKPQSSFAHFDADKSCAVLDFAVEFNGITLPSRVTQTFGVVSNENGKKKIPFKVSFCFILHRDEILFDPCMMQSACRLMSCQ